MTKTSYGEILCRELLKKWFPETGVLYNYRPIWLKNPDTGRNLELDIYYPDLKLAIEFNGPQHNLLLQKRKDYYKKYKCSKIGILMISVYHPMDLFKCKGLIRKHTKIKTISGRSFEKLLWELRAYSPKESESEWYLIEKEKSLQEEVRMDEKKKTRRAAQLSERRRFKNAVKFVDWVIFTKIINKYNLLHKSTLSKVNTCPGEAHPARKRIKSSFAST